MPHETLAQAQDLGAAFSSGLKESSDHLHELTNFDETFRFAPVSMRILPAVETLESYRHQVVDECTIEVLDNNKVTGYAGLIFPEGEACKLVAAILKSDADLPSSEEDKSDVLAEVANIMINTCLKHLAEPLAMKLSGGLPAYKEKLSSRMQEFLQNSEARLLLLESTFENEKRHIHGHVAIAILLGAQGVDQPKGIKGL